MTLLAQVLRWSKGELRPWQSDAVRRLFLQGELSSQDFDDLYAMLKSSHAIKDEQGRTPVPLSEEHIPETSANAVPVVLVAMKDLENVNRITRQQVLSFAPSGLTVIYGDNGSGKSGYARVLKHACRARTKGEPVLPNAGLARDKQGTPSARFEVLLADELTRVHWTYGYSPPVELSTVAVFDSHCARAYVDSEGDLIFMPFF